MMSAIKTSFTSVFPSVIAISSLIPSFMNSMGAVSGDKKLSIVVAILGVQIKLLEVYGPQVNQVITYTDDPWRNVFLKMIDVNARIVVPFASMTFLNYLLIKNIETLIK